MSDKRPTPALWIRWFAVQSELVQDLTIFRMRELCNIVFVTDRFVSRVRETGLNGFDFMKVWPFPENVDYELEYVRSRREAAAEVSKREGNAVAVKDESLVIELQLSERKITPTEKPRISRLQDELNAQLVIRSVDDPYLWKFRGTRNTKWCSKTDP